MVRASFTLIAVLLVVACTAQLRTVTITAPPGTQGAVYSPFGLLGSLPFKDKVDFDRVGRIFVVTKDLHFQEVDLSRADGSELTVKPDSFTYLLPPDSMESFRLADLNVPASANTSVTFINGIQLGATVDYEDLSKAGREYLDKENFRYPNSATRLELVPTHVKTYTWHRSKGFGTISYRFEDYSFIHCISWALVDAASGKELFRKELHGGHYVGKIKLYNNAQGARMEDSYASRKAFVSSLQSLLRDSDFISAVKKGSIQHDTPTLELLAITNDAAKHATSVQQCLPSVVTIRSSSGFGSGFFISEDGHLLTNDHVLGPKDSTVTVTLNNGLSLQATVMRRRPATDLALLRISGIQMTPLLCESGENAPGTEVYAIGTPEHANLSQTLTKGIISGNREFDGRSFIQTDVAINRGNSGGPLIDTQGRVIGVVTAKIMKAGTESLGFAIPIGIAFQDLRIK